MADAPSMTDETLKVAAVALDGTGLYDARSQLTQCFSRVAFGKQEKGIQSICVCKDTRDGHQVKKGQAEKEFPSLCSFIPSVVSLLHVWIHRVTNLILIRKINKMVEG